MANACCAFFLNERYTAKIQRQYGFVADHKKILKHNDISLYHPPRTIQKRRNLLLLGGGAL